MLAGTDVLGAALERLGLPLQLVSPLSAHARVAAEASPRLGLVSTGDEETILARHTADSLLFAFARRPVGGEEWMDLGSGGGFPGLVLAVSFPQTRFILVEANRKKAGFLEISALDLGLSNVEVIADRAETLARTFDVTTARAVDDPSRTFARLGRWTRPGGTMIVAASSPVEGAEVVRVDLPVVDSPRLLLMMTGAHD